MVANAAQERARLKLRQLFAARRRLRAILPSCAPARRRLVPPTCEVNRTDVVCAVAMDRRALRRPGRHRQQPSSSGASSAVLS